MNAVNVRQVVCLSAMHARAGPVCDIISLPLSSIQAPALLGAPQKHIRELALFLLGLPFLYFFIQENSFRYGVSYRHPSPVGGRRPTRCLWGPPPTIASTHLSIASLFLHPVQALLQLPLRPSFLRTNNSCPKSPCLPSSIAQSSPRSIAEIVMRLIQKVMLPSDPLRDTFPAHPRPVEMPPALLPSLPRPLPPRWPIF
jgi:hypothetical protein